MKKYKIQYDVLNIVACIAVVGMHVNSVVWSFSTDRYWMTSLVQECVLYFAVPVFFMITGATLMDYRDKYSTKEYAKKRFLKTGIPFLFWSLFSIVWSATQWENMDMMNALHSPVLLINAILNTQALSIYWFFPVLFSLYCLIPILSLIPKDKRKSIFEYMILILFVCKGIIPVVCPYLGIYYNEYFSLMIDGYAIFILLGYYVSHYEIKKPIRIMIYVLGIASVIFRYVVTYVLSIQAGSLVAPLNGGFVFTSVLWGLCVFTFGYYTNFDFIKETWIKWIQKISGCSFGVYLIHYYVMMYFVDTFQINILSIKWRIGGILLVYILSFVIVWILKKIPVLKKLVP